MAKVCAVLRWFFTWLVLLGVFASLHARASAADPCEVLVAMHGQEHSGHHVPKVKSLHHVHVWSLDGESHVLTAHVVMEAVASRGEQ